MILDIFFGFKRKCRHTNVAPNIDFGYCPDCGKAIKNEWYITRCSCCGIKLTTIERDGEVLPINKFCTNCGSHDFTVEKLENISFSNINYAVLVRKEINRANSKTTTQFWQEKTNVQPKLLALYQ